MFNIIINIITYLVSFILSIILSPVLVALRVFVPNYSEYFSQIIQFITYGLTYFPFFVKLLMVPPVLLTAVITINLGLLVFYFACQAVLFFVKAYVTFKP